MKTRNGIELIQFSIEKQKGIEKVWKMIFFNVWEPCVYAIGICCVFEGN